MMAEFENQIAQTIQEIKSQGLFKTERVITTPPGARKSRIADGRHRYILAK
jgi:hypothetical protein